LCIPHSSFVFSAASALNGGTTTSLGVNAGAVYLYTFLSQAWTQTAVMFNANLTTAAYAQYGYDVALSASNDYSNIGAPLYGM
jgi:hypothetical protein